MNRAEAQELANHWNTVVRNDVNLRQAYPSLQRSLQNLVPDNPSSGGAALVDGVPTVLVLAGGALFLAHATVAEDGKSANVTAKRLPLAADRVIVELTDGLAGGTESQPALLRHWKFSWPDGPSIEFDGVAHVYGGWGEGPDAAERVARAVAEALGWELPAG
jgi:hypothetical protein